MPPRLKNSNRVQRAPQPNSNTYWANVPVKDLGPQVQTHFLDYQEECERRGLYSIWDHVSSVYYGYDPQTDSCSTWIKEAGEVGELLNVHVNELHSLIQSQLNLTTADKLIFEPRAGNDSPEADTQATLGKQILNFYATDGKLEAKFKQACRVMFLYGNAYVVQLWDPYKGDVTGTDFEPVLDDSGNPVMETVTVQEPSYDPISGQTEMREIEVTRPQEQEKPRKAGDVVHQIYGPQDVALDLGCRSQEDVSWYIVRERWNRWDLAARFPEHRQLILDRPSFEADELSRRDRTSFGQDMHTEEISVLRLLHDRCEAVPLGMECLVVGDTVILPPAPLAYKRLPVHVMIAEETLQSPLGFSNTWNLLGPQAAYNAAASNGITTSDAGSIPKYAIARESNVDRQVLSNQMDVLYYNADPNLPNHGIPVLMQVPQFTNAYAEQMNLWRAAMERQSGVNAVVRGESAGKSGTDNALMASQAQQYMNGYSRAYVECARSVMLGIIECLQIYATDDRMVSIVGEDESPYIGWFRGENLTEIRQVTVEMGDPMTRTPQGKIALADTLLERFPGKISPDQFLSFMSNGRLEPLYKSEANEIKLIRAENAKLAKGEEQPVLVSDIHETHIQEHLAILSSPKVRANNAVTAAVLAHVAEHGRKWREIDSILLAATGQTPAPPPGMPGMPQPPAGPGAGVPPGPQNNGPQPPGRPPGPRPGQGSQQEQVDVPGASDAVAGVSLPNLPKPPGTN